MVQEIQHKHPQLSNLLHLAAIGLVLFGGSQLLQHLGFSWGWSLGLALGVFVVVVLVVGYVYAAGAKRAFDAIPLRQISEIGVGQHARIRVVIGGPAKLIAPMTEAPCVFYRATALVETSDGHDSYWEEAAVRTDGQLAGCADVSGSLDVNFTSAVAAVGLERLPHTEYEEPRQGDPLGVGLRGEYRVRVEALSVDDEVEISGLVEESDGGSQRLVALDDVLRVRACSRSAKR